MFQTQNENYIYDTISPMIWCRRLSSESPMTAQWKGIHPVGHIYNNKIDISLVRKSMNKYGIHRSMWNSFLFILPLAHSLCSLEFSCSLAGCSNIYFTHNAGSGSDQSVSYDILHSALMHKETLENICSRIALYIYISITRRGTQGSRQKKHIRI